MEQKKLVLEKMKKRQQGPNLKSLKEKNEKLCNDRCHKTYMEMEKNACDYMMGKTKDRTGTLLG